jgi:hypothetical protein
VVFEWFDGALAGSAHTLSFYFLELSTRTAMVPCYSFRVLFDEAVLSYPDGRSFQSTPLPPPAQGRWTAIGIESDDDAIKVLLPDPVPPQQVDGKLLGLVFVESETERIIGLAVGKASWDGRHVRWLSPDDLTYDIPPDLVNEIRPRFPEMSRSGYRRLDGFDYWVILTTPRGAPEDARQLVKALLTRSGSLWRRIANRQR